MITGWSKPPVDSRLIREVKTSVTKPGVKMTNAVAVMTNKNSVARAKLSNVAELGSDFGAEGSCVTVLVCRIFFAEKCVYSVATL